ncbi:hypothetical protein SAMN05216386_2648 [Nitrosospira briensis]|uniref:Uncharacterized protein n=1 Tax=Nitrosospira briensis TaxID=35799 RepID=A0A1I5EG19_9PROT|nr:hypothetical protein SAMN05216386_2648 [Nitrosospira briensis]
MINAATQSHHQIKSSQIALTRTKYFPQQALRPVAAHRKPLDFTSDNQPQSGMQQIVGLCEDLKKFATCRTSEANNRGKFFCFMQPVTFRKTNNTVPLANLTLRSDPQTNSSLGSASPDHSRAPHGFHSNPKTMSSLSSRDGWLISAFHRSLPLSLINKTRHYNSLRRLMSTDIFFFPCG